MSTAAETPPEAGFPERLARQTHSFYLALPFYLAVPLLLWAGMEGLGASPDWKLAGIGALGWWVALLLRAPVALAMKRQPPERGKRILVGASGPLEEGVRAAAILLLAPALPGALSLGLGWASIEVLFTVVNGLLVIRLLRRNDEEAAKARELLEAQGTLTSSAPWLGVVERVFASLLHIGFSLLLAAAPILAIATAPLHSAVNLLAVRLVPRMGAILLLLAVTSSLATAAGLLLLGALP